MLIEKALEIAQLGQMIKYAEGWSWRTYNENTTEAAKYADEVVILSEPATAEMVDYERRLQLDVDWRVCQSGWVKIMCPNTGESISCILKLTLGKDYPWQRVADDGMFIQFFPSSKNEPDWEKGIIHRFACETEVSDD